MPGFFSTKVGTYGLGQMSHLSILSRTRYACNEHLSVREDPGHARMLNVEEQA